MFCNYKAEFKFSLIYNKPTLAKENSINTGTDITKINTYSPKTQ
ncbi:hypothetical protein HMPREF0765_1424 [Sphingobacterium spiritivorum ATCC 33300]|uniref:Uncharacterized protein n=1 Tax=Sphingobacterium spiritivorum ATCC 33300 TaxID=525372 RepID=C2FVR8_SPHSI|nr:hypothetical protein HMPREF0765_1424 [Sphingobacterium spiritivorum ATCC 33300]